MREWLSKIGVKTLFTEPGSPWKKGYNESFNCKFRDQLLNTEVFWTLEETKVLIGKWRQHYNTVGPHSSLGCCPPAPEAIVTGKADPAFTNQGLQPNQTFPQTPFGLK